MSNLDLSLDGLLNNDVHYKIEYIIDLQEMYKAEKPRKFAGGKWSPRAWQLYHTLDDNDKKIVDEKQSHLYEDIGEDQWGNKIELAPEDVKCPKCGYGMLVKDGKYGLFYSCSQFPGCWGKEPHPDNLNPTFPEKKGKEKFDKERSTVTSYISYSMKRNGKPVKDGTPSEHYVWLDDDGPYLIRTRGSRQHLYKGDDCSFTYTVDWRGDKRLNRNTLKAWKKNGEEILKGDRRKTL